MRINDAFIQAISARFPENLTDDVIASRLTCNVRNESREYPDAFAQIQQLRFDLERNYVPTKEGIRLGRMLHEIARGFTTHRYQSKTEFVDICMTPADQLPYATGLKYVSLDPDSVPIYAVHGLPGVGKTALVKALQRLLPENSTITAEGDPPQSIQMCPALWIKVNSNFSLLSWTKNTLDWLGADSGKGRATVDALVLRAFKAFYRAGISLLIVDELQFASGKTSALRAINQLLGMRGFGIPIVYFANTDFIEEIFNSKAQFSQRLVKNVHRMAPLLRTDVEFMALLESHLSFIPYGHTIDCKLYCAQIYDLTAGSPRALAWLMELAAIRSVGEKRKMSIDDLLNAYKEKSFDVMRKHVKILSGLTPVDKKKHPELSSNNDLYDPTSEYNAQMKNAKISAAAEIALYTSYTPSERELADAAAMEILRKAGKVSPNVASIAEAKRPAKSKKSDFAPAGNSYLQSHLSNFNAVNPTPGDPSETKT